MSRLFQTGAVRLTLALLFILTVFPSTTRASTGEGSPLVSVCDLDLRVRVEPVYPERAAQRGIEGFVLLEFHVDLTGTTSNVRVIDADPAGTFDREAIRAVERWVFRPDASRDPVRTRLRLEFRLDGEAGELGPCPVNEILRDGFEP